MDIEYKISKNQFINKLLELVLIIEGGVRTLEEPLPVAAEQSLVAAIVAFGSDALPILHSILERDIGGDDNISFNNYGYIIDCIGKIKNSVSVPLLIEFHRCCTGFMTGAAALQALKSIGTEAAYQYLSDILVQYASGNVRVIESSAELHTSCQAMELWRDERAIASLKIATSIDNIYGMPDKAIQALATYPEAHPFLISLAEQNPTLKNTIMAKISQK
ncbi:MAG: hypothetical protein K8F30_10205 [Taibaiella sp.]|nr:hypothetical protein [Taibaiella sp.]